VHLPVLFSDQSVCPENELRRCSVPFKELLWLQSHINKSRSFPTVKLRWSFRSSESLILTDEKCAFRPSGSSALIKLNVSKFKSYRARRG